MPKLPSGFSNDAADKIWADHLGDNAYVRHRDRCLQCTRAFASRRPSDWCAEGERVFHEMLDEVLANVDEVLQNQN